MKILFINHFPLTGSGSGVYTLNLAKSLTSLGHECKVVFPENRRNYEKFENIELFPVFFKGEEDISNSLDFNFPCFSTHPRSSYNFFDMTDSDKKNYEEEFFKKIEDVVTSFKPDIIHTGHLWTLSGISSVIGEKHHIPLVITSHGTDIIGIEKEKELSLDWGSNWARKAFDYADSIITISDDNNKKLKELFSDSNKIIKINNGFDPNVFYMDDTLTRDKVLKEFNITNSYDHIISFVGKLTEIKGVDVLLDALKINSDNTLLTLIAGDGELREELEEKVKELKLNNVVFLGNLPQERLNKIYNIVDCSIVPSRVEAFGLVALEANACGAPVIASDIGGLSGIINDNTGILFEMNDSITLAQEINNILSNKTKFNRKEIAKVAKSKYSQTVTIKEIENIYNNILKKHKNVK